VLRDPQPFAIEPATPKRYRPARQIRGTKRRVRVAYSDPARSIGSRILRGSMGIFSLRHGIAANRRVSRGCPGWEEIPWPRQLVGRIRSLRSKNKFCNSLRHLRSDVLNLRFYASGFEVLYNYQSTVRSAPTRCRSDHSGSASRGGRQHGGVQASTFGTPQQRFGCQRRNHNRFLRLNNFMDRLLSLCL
jgi:hypothetical protein